MSGPGTPSEQVKRIHKLLKSMGFRLATAESMTAGSISARLASVSGASEILVGGLAVYRKEMKTKLPGLSLSKIDHWGAESAETTRALAEGMLAWVPEADVVLAITGAAPSSNTTYQTTAGTGSVFVCIGLQNGRFFPFETHLSGSRKSVLQAATSFALSCLEHVLKSLATPS
jgi:PncC family amidohydrolase